MAAMQIPYCVFYMNHGPVFMKNWIMLIFNFTYFLGCSFIAEFLQKSHCICHPPTKDTLGSSA